MRTLRKRLVCKNRGNKDENEEGIEKVLNRYVEKMKAKGWLYVDYLAYPSSGDAFFEYEMYVTLYKPNPKNEADMELARIVEEVKDLGHQVDQIEELRSKNVLSI